MKIWTREEVQINRFRRNKLSSGQSLVMLFVALFHTTFIVSTADAAGRKGSSFLNATVEIAAPSGAGNICNKYQWACAPSNQAGKLTHMDMEHVREVNSAVNTQVRQIDDRTQYRQMEFWALPTSRGGDCEDFALLKKRELIRRGIDPSRLLLATVLDRSRKAHAVLVLRSDTGDLVLDNLTNQIRGWRATGYIFLRMQNPAAPDSWIGAFLGG